MIVLKKILLAIGDENFSTILRNAFEPPKPMEQSEDVYNANRQFHVLAEEALHRVFLPELLELEKPDILIIHDLLLPSEAESKEENQRELLQLIAVWRLQFEGQLRVVVISERDKRDPFLQALVANNVLDIFADREFYADTLVKQLVEPPRYSNVSAYSLHDYTQALLQEAEELAEVEANTVSTNSSAGAPAITKRFLNQISSFVKDKRQVVQEFREPTQASPEQEMAEPEEEYVFDAVAETEEAATDLFETPVASIHIQTEPMPVVVKRETVPVETVPEEVDVEPPLEQEQKAVVDIPTRKEQKRSKRKESLVEITQPSSVVYQDRLLGRLTIAVTSLGHNVGSTHVSLQVATYLKRKGLTVAIVEGSQSGDFLRLRELFAEDGDVVNLVDPYFTVEGIHHYPYRAGEESIVPFLTDYQAIVIDIGAYADSPSIMEYFRAQKRLVVASGTDWKLALIGKFIEKYGKVSFDLCIPMADDSLIKDVSNIYEGTTTFRALPFHRNPYTQQATTEQVLDDMYSSYAEAGIRRDGINRMKWVVGLSSGVAAACIAGMTYMYFF